MKPRNLASAPKTQEFRRFYPDPCRFRWLVASVLLAGIFSAPTAISAAANEEVGEALQEQQRLLSQVSEHSSGQPGLLSGVEDTEANPRMAPRTPIPRDLPVAIFDEEKVVVPAGEWGSNKRMELLKRTLDADGDGTPEVQRYIDPRSDFMIRQIEDRNYDGVQDAWTDFEWGAVTVRVIDTNDDGNRDTWETYAEGRMTRREVDRDDDGVRDAFYDYNSESLTRERHDINNDRKIDLMVTYQARRRVKSEEDHDRDGRMDQWTTFTKNTKAELPARIDRDTKGRGAPDVFEYFDAVDGKAVLNRRDQDVNGDGDVDIVSIYVNGKLVRREIADPALMPEA